MSLATKIQDGLNKHMAKHKGGKSTVADKVENPTGNVEHFKIMPAKGGFHVETHMKAKKARDGYPIHEEPHHSVHKSLASVHKHMKEMCGITAGDEADSGKVEED